MFFGQCPGVIGPSCHGTDDAQVYAELCRIVDEWIELLKKDGKPLPPPTVGRAFTRFKASVANRTLAFTVR